MENYKHIDLLLTGYGGAGAYPQCFDNLSNNEKINEANNKKNFFKTSFRVFKDCKTLLLFTIRRNIHIDWEVI